MMHTDTSIEPNPLVELPAACTGKGEYIALVQYASPNGTLFSKSLKYSCKDPRAKDRRQVLRDISRMVGQRERQHIVAISVVKRCLHPKVATVPKTSRKPHFERLFMMIIQHAQSNFGPHVAYNAEAGKVPHVLPYTREELRWLPILDTITTRFGRAGQAQAVRIPLRGSEEVMSIDELLGFTPRLALAP
jgi:hypothetical protein